MSLLNVVLEYIKTAKWLTFYWYIGASSCVFVYIYNVNCYINMTYAFKQCRSYQSQLGDDFT